jgi:hypothetical protein
MRLRSFAAAVALVWGWVVFGPAAERAVRRRWRDYLERRRNPHGPMTRCGW